MQTITDAVTAARSQRRNRTRATVQILRDLRYRRDAGHRVTLTTDPAWLVDMAINRRAGWPDDPSEYRGSAHPLPDGRYPRKAEGMRYNHAQRLARKINTPRLRVHHGELGEWRRLILARIPHRIADD